MNIKVFASGIFAVFLTLSGFFFPILAARAETGSFDTDAVLELFAASGEPAPTLGSVAFSGDTVAVGAENTLYVFRYDGTVWVKETIEPLSGNAVPAIDGDTLLVGVPAAEKAYVYQRVGGVWGPPLELFAENASGFGNAVAVRGNTLLVAAANETAEIEIPPPSDDSVAGAADPDAEAADPDAATADPDDSPGAIVELINEAGAVYIFQRAAADMDWGTPERLGMSPPAEFERFGQSVAVSEDENTLVIAAESAVYVVQRDAAAAWTEPAKLIPGGGDVYVNAVVTIKEETIVVASPGLLRDGVELAGYAGRVDVYQWTGALWEKQQTLDTADVSDGADAIDKFGVSAALGANTLMAGSSGPGGGAVYVFYFADGVWSERQTLREQEVTFGITVARSGHLAAVGSEQAVYLYAGVIGAAPSGGAYNLSQQVTLFCFDCVQIHYSTDGSAPTPQSPAYTGLLDISANTELRFMGVDATGMHSVIQTEAYIIDAAPPEVVITSPEDHNTFYEYMPSVTGTASETDDGAGLDAIEIQFKLQLQLQEDNGYYLAENAAWTVEPAWLPVVDANPWTYDVGATFFPYGSYLITARAFDLAANLAESSPVSVKLSPPIYTELTLSLSRTDIRQNEILEASGKLSRVPANGIDFSSETITLTIIPMDETELPEKTKTTHPDAQGQFVFTFDTPNDFSETGTYALQAAFAGNNALLASESQLQSLTIGPVDIEAPEITVVSPIANSDIEGEEIQSIHGTTVDAAGGTGVESIEIQVETQGIGNIPYYLTESNVFSSTPVWLRLPLSPGAGEQFEWSYDIRTVIFLQGNYTISVRASDKAGNVTPEPESIPVYSSLKAATPLGGNYNTEQDITVYCLGCEKIIYTLEDGATPGSDSPSSAPPLLLRIPANAKTALNFIAVDALGNNSEVQTETYHVDTLAPEITIIPPYSPNGDNLFLAMPNIRGTAFDLGDGTGVERVEIQFMVQDGDYQFYLSRDNGFVSDSEMPEWLTAANTGIWHYDPGDTAFRSGLYTITARAIDNAGNFSEEETISFEVEYIDGGRAYPPGGKYNGTQQVRLDCSDCESIRYVLDTLNGAAAPEAEFTRDADAFLEISENTELKFFTADAQGNQSIIQTETYIIDAQPPVTAIFPPQGTNFNSMPSLRGTVVDHPAEGAGVDYVEVQFKLWLPRRTLYLAEHNNLLTNAVWLPVIELSADEWFYDTNEMDLPDGVYTISVRAVDKVGNLGKDITATVVIGDLAFTTLSLHLNSPTILQGGAVSAAGKLRRLPDIKTDLSGKTVALRITEPDGTNITANEYEAVTDTLGNYHFDLSGFMQKGTYALQVSFVGDEYLFQSRSEVKTVLVGSSAGYALLVQGKISNNEGLAAHDKTLTRIYSRLLRRGFLVENIRYFSYSQHPEVYAVPSRTDIQDTIEVWARERINGSPAPFYLIMVDHGNPESFLIDDDTITPDDLHAWLGTLENELTETARQESRIVILGACYSGSFIPKLSGPGRVILASAAAAEVSYKGLAEADGIRSGEFFIEALFQQLGYGASLKSAFENATASTEIFTRSGNPEFNTANPFLDDAVQHPLLDDNGDGHGSNLISSGFGDGQIAGALFLGAGLDFDTNALNNPADIRAVTPTRYLSTEETASLLFLQANDHNSVDPAAFEIRAPSIHLNWQNGSAQSSEQIDIDLPGYFLHFNESTEKFEFSYQSFDKPGKYEIFYTAGDKDIDAEEYISPVQRSVVYKNRPENKPPEPFNLVLPANDAETRTVLVFDWEDSKDPDSVTYTFLIAADPAFNTVVYQKEELALSMTSVDDDAELEDQTRYYWKVEAVDGYGEKTAGNATYTFVTNNVNALPGNLDVTFYSDYSYDTLTPVDLSFDVEPEVVSGVYDNGYHLYAVTPGEYTVSANTPGYETLEAQFTITAGQTARERFPMQKLCAPLCGLDNGTAIDANGQTLSTNAGFAGGVTIDNSEYQKRTTLSPLQTGRISGEISVDTKHIGKSADILIGIVYTPPGSLPQVFMLDDKGGAVLFESGPLTAAAENVPLGTVKNIDIYEGPLPAGELDIYFGYRLEDGSITYNGGEAIHIDVN
ncbi:MAG: hypothetical protein GY862_21680 [Gammaproteobacteria bacterium]|nr:hypothetical protein [Gammaproteobacteria bacterium]